jgi:hypothetical protein
MLAIYRVMRLSLQYRFLSADRHAHEEVIQLSSVPAGGRVPAELRVEMIDTDDEGAELAYSDFPWLTGNLPAFTRPAHEALAPLLDAAGRPIKLTSSNGEELVGLHVDVILDALDWDRSEITRFTSGRLMEIDSHVFRPEVIGSTPIFRLAEIERAGWTYVSQEYVDAVEMTGFPGAEFELLWTTENSDRS